jgi:hypothetical protein
LIEQALIEIETGRLVMERTSPPPDVDATSTPVSQGRLADAFDGVRRARKGAWLRANAINF